jgi:hypothetical protein
MIQVAMLTFMVRMYAERTVTRKSEFNENIVRRIYPVLLTV